MKLLKFFDPPETDNFLVWIAKFFAQTLIVAAALMAVLFAIVTLLITLS